MIELTVEQSEILSKELSKQEFWTIKEAKAQIESKLRLDLSNDQIQELLEDKFKKHFSTYRLSIGAILSESGKKESKTYRLEEGEKAMWRRVSGGE